MREGWSQIKGCQHTYAGKLHLLFMMQVVVMKLHLIVTNQKLRKSTSLIRIVQIQYYWLRFSYQISKLVNLLVPARDSVSSWRKVKTGEVSLDLLVVGDGTLAGLVEPELAFGGTRERRQRNK